MIFLTLSSHCCRPYFKVFSLSDDQILDKNCKGFLTVALLLCGVSFSMQSMGKVNELQMQHVFLLFPIRNINIIVKIELKKSGCMPERSEGHPD